MAALDRRRRPRPVATPPAPRAAPIAAPHPESPIVRSYRGKKAAIERIAARMQRVELTPQQRQLLKRGPQLQVVERIGQVGGREIAGQTYVPQPKGKAEAVIGGVLRAIGVAPKSFLKISATTKEPAAAVRHETTHALLFAQKIPAAQQHPIIDLTRVEGKASLGLPLTAATRALRSPSAAARQENLQLLRKLKLRRMRK